MLLAVAVASESLIRFVLDGAKAAWSVTLRDLAIRPMETAWEVGPGVPE